MPPVIFGASLEELVHGAGAWMSPLTGFQERARMVVRLWARGKARGRCSVCGL